ncbi:uncharacterized protein LOC103317663 isoform X1 [Nasonia vitripennis]|uniref:DUF4806 domain-containing protein n=2 Tax=Nasonia vitripennis TaxID=7425 RepID=A0A7M7IS06_NASVI|nr:uncharacterized protein LOC103317663 isoform X1 [Nasonia vitripennis]
MFMSHKQKTFGGPTPATAVSNLMADLERTKAENAKLFQLLQRTSQQQKTRINDITRTNTTLTNVNKPTNKTKNTVENIRTATNATNGKTKKHMILTEDVDDIRSFNNETMTPDSRHETMTDKRTSSRADIPKASTSNLTTEEFQRKVLQSLTDLGKRLSVCERMTTENNTMLQSLTAKKKVGKINPPSWLPFKSVQDLISFENVDDDTYNQTVDYLAYLGGHNVDDCISIYLKNSFALTENLLKKFSWLGQRTKNITNLSELRFITTCQEAVSLHHKFKKPNSTEFSDAVTKALKALKENLRRQIAAKAAEKQPPRRSRSRSPNGSEDSSETSTLRRKVKRLKKKQPLRQSRSRSRSPNGSEDRFETNASRRKNVVEFKKNNHLGRPDPGLALRMGARNALKQVLRRAAGGWSRCRTNKSCSHTAVP